MIGVAQLSVDPPVVDLYRDAAGMRKVLRVKPEDGDIAFVQFADDGIGVLIVIVGDDQDRGSHLFRTSATFDRMESRNRDSCSPSSLPSSCSEGLGPARR
jgi:hypothetical protein